MIQIPNLAFVFLIGGLFACSSPSNDRAIDMKDLETVQAEEAKQLQALASTKDALTASELLELSDCTNIDCVQRYMKDHSNDFVHAKKGEFAALHRSTVTDTAGHELVMPLSTLYVDVNPQASWRMAHTLHRVEMGNRLLEEFKGLGFLLIDSGYYRGLKSRQTRYRSPQYPGKSLYITTTFAPWYLKGMYKKVTWPCMVFELYGDELK